MNIELTRLNLPAYEPELRVGDTSDVTEIYDRLRGKWVALTPEEWVRQNFVNYMIEYLGYPAGRMANEVGITLNGTRRRCDSLVYGPDMRVAVIVEYKAPSVVITQRAFDQIARYNMVLDAMYLIVTNGLRHYCCRMNGDGTYCFLSSLPTGDAEGISASPV